VTLPTGWRSDALRNVCTIVSGGTPKTGVPEYWDGDIPWITPKDLSQDRSQVVHGGSRTITRAGLAASSAALYPAGSVIISSRAPIGYVAIAGREMSANQGCKIAVPPADIDSRYLYWYLLAAKPDLEARASGTTFKEISGTEFGRTILRWPSLDEQRQLVTLLEQHLSRLDAAAQGLQRSVDRAKAMWHSVLMSATDTDGESTTLGELVSAVRGVTYSRADVGAAEGGGYVGLLRATNFDHGRFLREGQLVYVKRECVKPAQYVRAGDMLVAASSGSLSVVGKSVLVPELAADTTFGAFCSILRPTAGQDPEFLSYWIRRPDVRRRWSAAAAGTNINNLKAKDVLATPVPRLTLDQQKQAAARLKAAEDALLGLSSAVALQKRRSAALRQSLLLDATSGGLSRRNMEKRHL
jgi:type I restriction enzyme S subunit